MIEESYGTKVNVLWHILVIVMISTAVFIIASVYLSIIPEEEVSTMLLLLIPLSAVLTLIFYAFFVIKYTFRWDSLYVRGVLFMKFDIPYSSITEVKEKSCFITFWFHSYTFMSLDQLEITFSSTSVGRSGSMKVEEQSVIISPKKKEEFISMLEARLPGIWPVTA